MEGPGVICANLGFADFVLGNLRQKVKYRGLERRLGKNMITDPVGDLLTRIRNAALANKREVSVPCSKLKHAVLNVLDKEGYVADIKKVDGELQFVLVYQRRKPLISGVKGVSKPGLRIYRKVNRLPSPLRGAGISIVSTSKGVMSNKEARKNGLGGEVLGEVW